MYKTYILYSAIKDKFYVGHTNDMDRRLLEHNESKNLGTNDWILKYTEVFGTRPKAIIKLVHAICKVLSLQSVYRHSSPILTRFLDDVMRANDVSFRVKLK